MDMMEHSDDEAEEFEVRDLLTFYAIVKWILIGNLYIQSERSISWSTVSIFTLERVTLPSHKIS